MQDTATLYAILFDEDQAKCFRNFLYNFNEELAFAGEQERMRFFIIEEYSH